MRHEAHTRFKIGTSQLEVVDYRRIYGLATLLKDCAFNHII